MLAPPDPSSVDLASLDLANPDLATTDLATTDLANPDLSTTVHEMAGPPGFGPPASPPSVAPLPTRPARTQGSSPLLPTPSLPTRPLSSPLLPSLDTPAGSTPLPAASPVLADRFAPTLPMTEGAAPELPTRPVEVPLTPEGAPVDPSAAVRPEFAAFQTGPRLAPRPTHTPVVPAVGSDTALSDQPLAEAPFDAGLAGYVNRPQALMDMDAEVVDSADTRDESLPDPPAPLLATGWLGKFALLSGFLAVPGLFVGDFVGLGFGVASWIALVVWSAMVTANARRSRPSTLHARAPRPLPAALSWFIAPVIAVGAAYGLVVMTEWVDAASYEEQSSRSMALAAMVCVIVVAMFAAWYRPYGLLARTARWVSADGGTARKWFAAPFIAALLSIGIQLLATLLVVAETEADGALEATSIGAVALIVVSLCLPWVAWLFTGSRAIGAIESGVAHTHARAVQASRNPEEISAHVAAYIHGASTPEE